jgi:hypothetical protein
MSAMFDVSQSSALQNPYLLTLVSLGIGGFVTQVAGFVDNNLALGPRLMIGATAALITAALIVVFSPAITG